MQKIPNINFKLIKEKFTLMDNEKTTLGLSLIKETEFMKSTLVKLRNDIKKNGVVVDMCQGKYSISRSNPSISAYNTTIKNYQSCIKQINELLEGAETLPSGITGDEFDEFNK